MNSEQIPEKITLRRGCLDDARTLAEFNRNLAKETEGLALDAKVVLNGVTAVLENSALGFYLLAEVVTPTRYEVVASLLVTREWSDWRDGEWWWLQSVYVAHQWRRRGLYRRLHSEVQGLAQREQSVCGLRLYVEQHNQVAQDTYGNLGMQRTHYQLFEQLFQ